MQLKTTKKALFIWTVKTMRRLISFILLIAVFWGGWQLFLYQARPQKEAVVTIGATLPLSGTNAETGLAAQDALNLALKEWNSRQNRYRYRIFYLDDSGKAEQTQKKSSYPVGKTKRRGRNHIVDAGCRRSNSVGRQIPAASLYLRFRQRTERRPVQFQPLSFLPHRQVHRQLPSGGGKTARILFFQPVRCARAADFRL